MVLELDPERCASEDVEPQKRWTLSGVPARTLNREREWTSGCVQTRTLSLEGGEL